MIRRNYEIGSHQYIVDHLDANTDLKNNLHFKKFVMLRSFNIVSDIISDTDIYIIDTDSFDAFVKSIYYGKEEGKFEYMEYSDEIVFPIIASTTAYSQEYNSFNNNYKSYSLYDNYVKYEYVDSKGVVHYDKTKDTYDYGTDVYKLVDENGELKNIKCDILRIYHPTTQKSLNGIIHISNYINNIHFHYLCKEYSKYSTNSETELRINNQVYSEYIDIKFPNIYELFKSNGYDNYSGKELFNIYYEENLNVVYSTHNNDFMNRIKSGESVLYIDDINIEKDSYFYMPTRQRVPFNLFIQPFRIIEEIDPITKEYHNVKLYLKQYNSIENNFYSYPFTVIIYPYSEVNVNDHSYVLDTEIGFNINTFNSNFRFNITSSVGFVNSEFSIITKFNYPNKNQWLKKYDGNEHKALMNAYKFFYGVTDDDYNYFWVNILREKMPDDEVLYISYIENHWDDIDEKTNLYKYKRKIYDPYTETYIWETIDDVSSDEKLKRLIDINFDNIANKLRDDEYELEYGTTMNFIGYHIEIATDKLFKHIIYDTTVNCSINDIDNFSFAINNIFNSWNEITENVVCRISFIDKIVGQVMTSNIIVFSNDDLKYMISKDINTIYQLNLKNKNMKEIQVNNSTAINFIDSINVVTTETSPEKNNINNIGKFESRVILKPIFYKANDLQNIKIRSNIQQNIGINLNQYMTKVESFKLKINDIEYIETGRNDIFVIFNINANTITSGNGTYDIFNQDNEYISSGNWIIY